MLRIYRKPDGQKFEYRHIDKAQVAQVISTHLKHFGREFASPFAGPRDPRTCDKANTSPLQEYAEAREVPASEFAFEWQDGNGDWDESKPAETVRVVT